MTTQVSVLMPMRNAEAYVQEAIESVLACQDVPLELIVIDDGSTDGSRSIVEKLDDARIRLIDGPCRGISAAMNKGMNFASGAVVMRCDSDDIYPPGRIKLQVKWMENHPDVVAVCGAFQMIDKKNKIIASPFSNIGNDAIDITEEIKNGEIRTSLCTFAMRADIAKTINFRDFFETAEDIDYIFRLREKGSIFFLNNLWYKYRIHNDSITHSQKNIRREFFEKTARNFAGQRMQLGVDALESGSPPSPPSGDEDRPHSAKIHIQKLAVGDAWRLYEAGDDAAAIRSAFFSAINNPFGIFGWIALFKIGIFVAFPFFKNKK